MASILDNALGFTGIKDQQVPGPQPAVATTDPATNTPGQTPAQESYDRAQSYLTMQSQIAFSKQLKELTKADVSAPPTFGQTEQGQKMIKFAMMAVVAWLFLFKGKL